MTRVDVSAAESVEAFAKLCAALDDPFADRGGLLAAARLDESGFGRLQEKWAERLVSDVEGAGARFAEAYSASRAQGNTVTATAGDAARPTAEDDSGPRTAVAAQEAPHVSNPEAPPGEMEVSVLTPTFMRDPPNISVVAVPGGSSAAAGREPLATETGPLDLAELFKPAVPFDPGWPSNLAVATVPGAAVKKAPRHESTETVEFDIASLLKGRAPVPFEKPSAHPKTAPMPAVPSPTPAARPQATPATPETAGPRRRLIRFDPQTGAPLATPYWQDLSSTEDKKR